MKCTCTDLMKILADTIETHGNLKVGITVLTDNVELNKNMNHYDWGVFDKTLYLVYEIEDLKEFKKKLK